MFVRLTETGERMAYLFPFAGGSASAYRPYARLFGSNYSVRAAQLPGRQDRLADAPFIEMTHLAQALADEVIRESRGRRVIFFGHSFGALIAFEVTRDLRRRGAEQPMILGVSAARAPMIKDGHRLLASLSDQELAVEIRKMGGFPTKLAEHPDFIKLTVDAVRTDLVVENTYAYYDEHPLEVPISVFGGRGDDIAVAELDAWRNVTTRRANLRMYPGDHFYLWEHAESVIAALLSDLGESPGESPQ